MENHGLVGGLRRQYPAADVIGCSTAGEIHDTEVSDGGLVLAAVEFAHSRVRVTYHGLDDAGDSAAIGNRIARDLAEEDLVHVIVLAEGIHVNGSALVVGLRSGLPGSVTVSGGLAADGDRFQRTTVHCNGETRSRAVVAVGLYGNRLHTECCSRGGWDPFGPDRLITRAEGNVLYELDCRPALDLYRRYLGPHADGLPASGLLFPLSLRGNPGEPRVVRTILGIDEAERSLIFAGDVPEGEYARLMRANIDRLVDGAHNAGEACLCEAAGAVGSSLSVLVSCVGRRLVLKQRVDEEVESVRRALGSGPSICGFYAYGEIGPFGTLTKCELHNQTMTVTTIRES